MYKSQLRPLIREANLYHISDRPDGVHWDGMEYFSPLAHRGVVYVFHGSSQEEAEHRFLLRGLTATAKYQVHFHDHSAVDQILNGESLMTQGVTLRLPLANTSEIVYLQELAKPSPR